LGEVRRFNIGLPRKAPLTEADFAAIRASFDQPTFERIRDRAIFEMTMATAFRFDTLIVAPLAALNKITGDVILQTKGRKLQRGQVETKAMVYIRKYLQLRPKWVECSALFVSLKDGNVARKNRKREPCRVCGVFGSGHALSYDGGHQVWKRIQRRSSMEREHFGPHLIREIQAARTMARFSMAG
jgi:hypothetical protein